MSKDQTQQPPNANPMANPAAGSAKVGAPANPGVNGSTITQDELNNGAFANTAPAQLYGPTAALYGVPNGGYYYGAGVSGPQPGSGTGSSANQPAGGSSSASPLGAPSDSTNQLARPAAPLTGTNNQLARPATGVPSAPSTPASPLSGTPSNNGNTYTAPPTPTPQVGAVNPSLANGLNAPNIDYSKILNGLDTSKVPGLVGGDALSSQMTAAQQAAYKQATGYLDPQWANAQRDLETKLVNQGIPQGSEAYQRAVDEFNRNKTFAYSQAQDAAVQQGNAAEAQLFGQGLASNQNAFGQALSGGQFTNAAQQQAAQQILAQLGLSTNLNIAQIGANTANNSLNEQIAQNNFTNSMSTRQQDINELLLQQQNPLNMYSALTQGSGVTQPNFAQTPGTNVAGTDISSIIAAALGQQNNVYNTQVGSANSQTAGYAAILAAMMPYIMSDRRLKRNVRMLGMHEVGVPLYAFDYVWGEPGVGVMADELAKIRPDAVKVMPSGYAAVNYGAISRMAA